VVPAQPIFEGRDRFEQVESNPVKQVSEHPVSTFSVDVDTASYSVVRHWLNQGKLPPKDAVRVEELINYFSYDYARPKSASEPFGAKVSVLPSPWSAERQLMHIGIQGYELASTERPRANLVLLIDVSGSMRGQGRLSLLKNAFKMLLDNMRPDDTIGIVTYASGAGVALEPTKIADKHKILAAIDALGAGGSTAGAQGIQDAYRLAAASFDKQAVNRVILGTDGDFNVGITDQNELKGFIERKRQSGIFLSILGVGRGNYNDALMQTLAQNGNGIAAYIDTLNEARKVLVEEASSILFPIAKDVKIQFEFNPAQVRDYRLIGYETRALRRQDFNNDKVDAGDVGSGHTVTAIYEITPVDAKKRVVDPLRYSRPEQVARVPQRKPDEVAAGRPGAPSDGGKADEIGFLKLRYKLPAESVSRLMSMPVLVSDKAAELSGGSSDVRFAVAVAAFGQLLRGETQIADYGFDDVIKLANGARGSDPFGLRAEFVNLVRLAKSAQP
jgi:Ca-activated chloride channel family protein